MVYIKVHDTENGSIIAMCDEQLIDKVLGEGDIVIDVKSYNSFYKGEKMNKNDAGKLISELDHVYSANIIGSESVDVAISSKLIDKKGVMWIGKVPYAHSYSMD
ncbi:MAG: DUF424 family protein [Candidatus Micrarchaeaceae archaeon]